MNRNGQNLIWCYFCNLVHSTYREIRHIGEPTDLKAKCHVSQQYSTAAQNCLKNRQVLKSTVPFKNHAATNTDDVIKCYQSLTGLSITDLIDIFRNQKWSPGYGGAKWAAIATVLLDLKQAIDDNNAPVSLLLVEKLKVIRHNSGPLVPSSKDWRKNSWLREKWPVLCE